MLGSKVPTATHIAGRGVITFELPECTGCRTCELACSFRREQAFNPARSAIRVIEKGRPGTYLISVALMPDDNRHACVRCYECAEACPVSSQLKEEFRRLG